jgi:hypothetical protein
LRVCGCRLRDHESDLFAIRRELNITEFPDAENVFGSDGLGLRG